MASCPKASVRASTLLMHCVLTLLSNIEDVHVKAVFQCLTAHVHMNVAAGFSFYKQRSILQHLVLGSWILPMCSFNGNSQQPLFSCLGFRWSEAKPEGNIFFASLFAFVRQAAHNEGKFTANSPPDIPTSKQNSFVLTQLRKRHI